jgi:hypothetical protein
MTDVLPSSVPGLLDPDWCSARLPSLASSARESGIWGPITSSTVKKVGSGFLVASFIIRRIAR